MFSTSALVHNSVIPVTLNEIGEHTFDESGLTSLDLLALVSQKLFSAFMDCDDLTTALFPSSLREISGRAFYDTGLICLVSRIPISA